METIVPTDAINTLGQSILKLLKTIRSEWSIVTPSTTGHAKLSVEPCPSMTKSLAPLMNKWPSLEGAGATKLLSSGREDDRRVTA